MKSFQIKNLIKLLLQEVYQDQINLKLFEEINYNSSIHSKPMFANDKLIYNRITAYSKFLKQLIKKFIGALINNEVDLVNQYGNSFQDAVDYLTKYFNNYAQQNEKINLVDKMTLYIDQITRILNLIINNIEEKNYINIKKYVVTLNNVFDGIDKLIETLFGNIKYDRLH